VLLPVLLEPGDALGQGSVLEVIPENDGPCLSQLHFGEGAVSEVSHGWSASGDVRRAEVVLTAPDPCRGSSSRSV
jgi:hypothetical protein